jgi:hypothetical protein
MLLGTWNEAMSLGHPLPKAADIRLPKTLVEMTMPTPRGGHRMLSEGVVARHG